VTVMTSVTSQAQQYSQWKLRLKRWVFRRLQKTGSDCADVTWCGKHSKTEQENRNIKHTKTWQLECTCKEEGIQVLWIDGRGGNMSNVISQSYGQIQMSTLFYVPHYLNYNAASPVGGTNPCSRCNISWQCRTNRTQRGWWIASLDI